jgi:hypothetical protein
MSLSVTDRRRRRWIAIICLVILVIAGGGYLAYDKLLARDIPVHVSDEDNFKYGSIGNFNTQGLPYAIWVVLPEVFADYLPGSGGYASLGFRWEPGRTQSEAPIGFSRARVGVERMAPNCALCHVTTYRRAPGAPLEYALAGPGNTVDVLGYQNFLISCASDEKRFSADVLLPAMAQKVHLSWLDRIIFRFVLIPLVRKSLLEQGRKFAWTKDHDRPAWGPGRIDPFNPVKFDMLRLADDGTIGNSDMQAVWNIDGRDAIRPNGPFHWDGLNNSFREVVLSSALGDGMQAKEYDQQTQDSLRRIGAFFRRTKAPVSPYRPDDTAAVSSGRAWYLRLCAQCHDPAGARTLTVVAVEEVGTDRHRVDMWTTAARDAYNAYRGGYDWDFRHFQKIDGYVAEPLDGLWLRAPYLHNGSVPTLADLLELPQNRPKAFVRGNELLDSKRGGFDAPTCDPASPRKGEFCFDTALPGNANSGHVYGTDLDSKAKADLLAYLLTL